MRIYEELRTLGYDGGYDAVRRYAADWSKAREVASKDAYVPLSFDPGEAYQFDWSHEIVVLDGVTTTVKVAHVRLCYSRMPFVRAYPRESQEMVFDAHDKAFAFFGGACARGIYDNMKTAVDVIFIGKNRAYNRRFLQMCGHYLVEPVACTPASGWEKGQVENQVGVIRRRLFVPRPKFKSLRRTECLAGRPVPGLGQGPSPSGDARQDDPRRVRGRAHQPDPLCRPFRRVPCRSGGGVQDLPGALRQEQVFRRCPRGGTAGRDPGLRRSPGMPAGRPHRRPAMYVPSGVARPSTTPCTISPSWRAKPGALRNGAPFKDWELPPALGRVRRRLEGKPGGDRQMVEILGAVLSDGLEAVEAACAEALADNVHSAGVVLNILARQPANRRRP